MSNDKYKDAEGRPIVGVKLVKASRTSAGVPKAYAWRATICPRCKSKTHEWFAGITKEEARESLDQICVLPCTGTECRITVKDRPAENWGNIARYGLENLRKRGPSLPPQVRTTERRKEDNPLTAHRAATKKGDK